MKLSTLFICLGAVLVANAQIIPPLIPPIFPPLFPPFLGGLGLGFPFLGGLGGLGGLGFPFFPGRLFPGRFFPGRFLGKRDVEQEVPIKSETTDTVHEKELNDIVVAPTVEVKPETVQAVNVTQEETKPEVVQTVHAEHEGTEVKPEIVEALDTVPSQVKPEVIQAALNAAAVAAAAAQAQAQIKPDVIQALNVAAQAEIKPELVQALNVAAQTEIKPELVQALNTVQTQLKPDLIQAINAAQAQITPDLTQTLNVPQVPQVPQGKPEFVQILNVPEKPIVQISGLPQTVIPTVPGTEVKPDVQLIDVPVTTEKPVISNTSVVKPSKTACTISTVSRVLKCEGVTVEENFECEIIPEIAEIEKLKLRLADLTIKPDAKEISPVFTLLSKKSNGKFTFVDPITHISELLHVYIEQTVNKPGFLVRDRVCFAQFASLLAFVPPEQIKLTVIVN